MLRSLHNFFFVSFDPGGLIMVDKPPLGLWVEAASAKLFGFSPLSLLIPEAIIGALGVLLLYRALARRLGGWAAVAGALALAVFPSFVAISRTTNVDALLILLMILACDAGMRAIETGRWRTLLWSAALVGLAFNTKTLAAYLVVPGIALGYLLCAGVSVRRRLAQLLTAGLVMVVVSGAWIAVVELTPASKRPFVGSSTDNTELGLTFSYNGFGRVGGQTGGPGNIPKGSGGLARTVTPGKANQPRRLSKRRPPRPRRRSCPTAAPGTRSPPSGRLARCGCLGKVSATRAPGWCPSPWPAWWRSPCWCSAGVAANRRAAGAGGSPIGRGSPCCSCWAAGSWPRRPS